MTKKLNELAMQNELSGSAFFQPPGGASPPETNPASPLSETKASDKKPPLQLHASNHASELASTLAPYSDEVVESIRRVVKDQGKEVSFLRVTPEEKSALAAILYTYKRQGFKTSENEVNRIAVNFLLEDYRANGQNSLLARVLEALAA